MKGINFRLVEGHEIHHVNLYWRMCKCCLNFSET